MQDHEFPEWLQMEADEYLVEQGRKNMNRALFGCAVLVALGCFVLAVAQLVHHATVEDETLPTTIAEAGE